MVTEAARRIVANIYGANILDAIVESFQSLNQDGWDIPIASDRDESVESLKKGCPYVRCSIEAP